MRRLAASRHAASRAAAASCTGRRFASSAGLPPHKLMPMPRLSPSMRTGKIVQWLARPGDEVVSQELVLEVSTAELTEDPEDGTLVLEIESHEDGYLAKILLADGESGAPDDPIAVVCDNAADVAAFADFKPSGTVEPATFAWQGFLKDPAAVRECGKGP